MNGWTGQGGRPGAGPNQQPLTARILAVACALDEITGGEAVAADEAVRALTIRPGFDRQVVDALAAELGTSPPKYTSARPAGLTEREVEAVRLGALGLSVREIGQRLVISHHTARHHIESAYGKIGCSSRAAAALFAAENGLLD